MSVYTETEVVEALESAMEKALLWKDSYKNSDKVDMAMELKSFILEELSICE